MPNNGFYGSPSLTQFAFLVSLITIVFFQGFAGQDDGCVAYLFNPPITPVTDRLLDGFCSVAIGLFYRIGSCFCIMLVFLMTDNANHDVAVFGRDDGYFVAVFIALVVFAFRNHISMRFVQGINFVLVFGLLCPYLLIRSR